MTHGVWAYACAIRGRVPDAVQRSPGDAKHRPVTMHRRAGTHERGRVTYGPRISSAPRRKSGGLRSIRGTQTRRRLLAAPCARVVHETSAQQRAWGMPGARCTRSRACRVDSTRVSHHGRTGTPGIPARNGFNGFLRALPGDRACLSPSPRGSLLPRSLTPAIEASGPHDFAVREIARSSVEPPASTASQPYVRDDRETPLLCEPGWREMCR
jgi:hypothetical protein